MTILDAYHEVDFGGLTKLESSLSHFSRDSWDEKLLFRINSNSEFDVCLLDHKSQRLIFFERLLSRRLSNLSIAHQIYFSWLVGFTRKRPGATSGLEKDTLSPEDVSLFFTGSKNEVARFRAGSGLDELGEPSLEWHILIYPLEMVRRSSLEVKKGYDLTEKEDNYSIWFAYGVVGKDSHKRTDKEKTLVVVKEFMSANGFDVTKQFWGRDTHRNWEPIVLFGGKDSLKRKEYDCLVGVNFGYDNGYSSFRVGLGAHFREENAIFCQINNHVLQRKGDDDGLVDVWIHHKNYLDVCNYLEQFLEKGVNAVFNRFDGAINASKKYQLKGRESALRLMKNTHRTDYAENEDLLAQILSSSIEKHGVNLYSQFITWNKFAKEIEGSDEKKSSMAQFIASCLLKWANSHEV